MPAIKCEVCGSGSLIKRDGFFICEYCNTKYSLDEVQKLLGTVKIDRTDIKSNLRTLARRAYQNHEFAQAEKYYADLLVEDANDWEAYYYHAICLADCNQDLDHEDLTALQLQRTIMTTFNLLKDSLSGDDLESALTKMFGVLDRYILTNANHARQYYLQNRQDLLSAWIINIITAYATLYDCFDICLTRTFPKYGKLIAKERFQLAEYLKYYKKYIDRKFRKELQSKLK